MSATETPVQINSGTAASGGYQAAGMRINDRAAPFNEV